MFFSALALLRELDSPPPLIFSHLAFAQFLLFAPFVLICLKEEKRKAGKGMGEVGQAQGHGHGQNKKEKEY